MQRNNCSPNLRQQSERRSARMRRRLSSLRYFAMVYAAALPRILWRCTAGLLLAPGRSLALLHHVLDYYDIEAPDSVLGTLTLEQALPGADSAAICVPGVRGEESGSHTRRYGELMALACLARAAKCASIFEFGTNIGSTTRLLAMNAPGAIVTTLDLPQDLVRHRIGESYLGTVEAARIRQLNGDSLHFDASEYRNSVDFCWVDASHGFYYVMNDSRLAIKMVRAGGWIAWHDYRHTAWWSGVTQALRQLNLECGGGAIHHLRGTTIALMQLSPEIKRRLESGATDGR